MNLEPRHIFATTFPALLAKELGTDRGQVVLNNVWCRDAADSPVPGIRSLHGLHVLCAERIGFAERLTLLADGVTRPIGKARSLAAGAFLRKNADVWVTVDDDVFVDTSTMHKLVTVACEGRTVVAAPYLLRAYAPSTKVRPSFHRAWGAEKVGGVDVARVDRFGFGAVAIHRSVIQTLAQNVPLVDKEVDFPFPAIFTEVIEDGYWIGEDHRFGALCDELGIACHLLLDEPVTHAGMTCKVVAIPGGNPEVLLDEETEAKLKASCAKTQTT